MVVEVTVPPLGESVSRATLSRIFKAQGDLVRIDEMLAEIETDKASLEITSEVSGKICAVHAQEGDEVPIGSVVFVIDDTVTVPDATTISASAQLVATPSQSNLEKKEEVPTTPESAPKFGTPSITPRPVPSPAARKLARDTGIDFPATGTGPGGRITKADMMQVVSERSLVVETDHATSCTSREKRVPMSGVRRAIAKRLKTAQNDAALLSTFNEIDMSSVIKLRTEYKESFQQRYGVKLGFMSFFVKAVVVALKEVPAVNAEIQGTEIIYKNYYNLSIAVGTKKGLFVPVLREADTCSFATN